MYVRVHHRCDLRVVGGDHTRTRLVVSTRKRARNETGHRDDDDDDDRIAAPAPHRHAQKKNPRDARRERDDDGLLL